MKTRKIESSFDICNSSELTAEINTLLDTATTKLADAYVPYSNFRVGAAVLMENGEMVAGCNQENAAYPLCTCGERVALTYAGAKYPNIQIKALAIVIKNDKKKVETPASPCGSCRQIISEYQSRQKDTIQLYLKAESDEIYHIKSIFDILPLSFNADSL